MQGHNHWPQNPPPLLAKRLPRPPAKTEGSKAAKKTSKPVAADGEKKKRKGDLLVLHLQRSVVYSFCCSFCLLSSSRSTSTLVSPTRRWPFSTAIFERVATEASSLWLWPSTHVSRCLLETIYDFITRYPNVGPSHLTW
ncbi:hypothetical protein BDZ89DRAFT_281411 [Hymenopellis radicata]|nr:hypothetical protein BDZ89DRAFT_281411 [Hymenopellis radicata]